MYSQSLIIDPRMAGAFRCKDCHMNFQSQHLLQKHKLKFCVGSTGDPDDLQLRRGLRTSSPRRIISPDDRDDYRRNPNQDQQLRSLAESHGRHMEFLQGRNRDLEKQREDIRKQLENLGRRTVVPPQQDNSADLLRELREQEIRNQRALDDLKRQLHGMQNQKVNVIEIEKPVYQPPAPQPAPPPPEPPKKPIVFPVYYGKSLVAEITAIRQAYLQNGGNDPDVLSQMAQMQAEAQAIEDQMNQKPRSPREKPKDKDSSSVKFLEMENDRLIQELRLLQDQNLLAQNRNRSGKEGKKSRSNPNQIHLHVNVPKSYFGDNSHKKRRVGKEQPKHQTVSIINPAHSYNQQQVQQQQQQLQQQQQVQQPLMTSFSLPQQQWYAYIPPNVAPTFSYSQQQPTLPTNNTQQQQQVDPYYPKLPQAGSQRRPKGEYDMQSFRSEPIRKPREKVIKYRAAHQPDGTVHISRSNLPRSNSFGYSDHKPPAFIPPLDLRGLSTPKSYKYEKENKYESYDYNKPYSSSKVNNGDVSLYKPSVYPQEIDRQPLSQVAETTEVTPYSQSGAMEQLPVLPGQEVGSRSGSRMKPMSRSGQVDDDNEYLANDNEPQTYYYDDPNRMDDDNRPQSNPVVESPESGIGQTGRGVDTPARSQGGSPVDTQVPDVTWQVNKSTPPAYSQYQY